MNGIQQYVIDVVRRYLSQELDLDGFRAQFAGCYAYAREHKDDRLGNELLSKLMLPFAEFSGGHRSVESLQSELAKAVRPFDLTAEVRLISVNGLVRYRSPHLEPTSGYVPRKPSGYAYDSTRPQAVEIGVKA